MGEYSGKLDDRKFVFSASPLELKAEIERVEAVNRQERLAKAPIIEYCCEECDADYKVRQGSFAEREAVEDIALCPDCRENYVENYSIEDMVDIDPDDIDDDGDFEW